MFRQPRSDLISKYIGGGDNERVRLNKLGGADWSKGEKHAPKRLQRSWPRGLIKLYAERAKGQGLRLPAGRRVAARV